LNEAAEIDLTVALERLREAAAAEGINLDPNRTSSSDPQAEIIDVISALALIPNDDLPWHEWIRIGLAILRATGGSEEGREAFHKWSAKSGKYESATTDERWDHFARSPPDQIGAATLFFEARQADPDWIEPTLEAFIDEVFDIPDSALAIRSRIRIRAGELHSVTTKAEESLIAFDAPLFSRGANIVRPIVEDAEAAKGRRTKVARLIAVTADGLVDHLSRAAVFERYDARSKKLVRIDPPRLIAATLLSRDGEWALRPLAGVITTPTLRPDGSLLAEEGYDPVTRLLLRGPPLMKPVKEAPTKDDAANALKLLKGLLSEFPFADQPSHSVGLSALISPIVRGALSVVPLHAASAPTAGSGKSYLFDLCATIAMGQRCPVIAAGRTEEETEKRLGAALLAGQSLISIDNLNGELGGDFLCQAVERPIVNVRILGKSELVPIESRTTIFANGNNMRVVGDMVRRTLRSLIDANQERPERRTFRSKPFETVLSDRGQYVAAALTIVRAYIVAGQPDPCPPLASFEDWSDLVRSALVWLGCADPAETIEASREDDPETSTLRQVVAAWKSVIGINEFRSAAELIVAANASLASFDEGDEKSSLHVAFQLVAKDGHELNPVKFGRWLSRYRGRVIDGLKLVSVEDLHAKIQRWALSPARDHL